MKEELTKQIKDVENTISEASAKLVELRAQVEAMPGEDSGEWIPRSGDRYYFVCSDGDISNVIYDGDSFDGKCIARGNCYPTEESAKAAERRDQILKRWDRAGDRRKNQQGVSVCIYHQVSVMSVTYPSVFDGTPRWSNEEKARAESAAIDIEFGEGTVDKILRGEL